MSSKINVVCQNGLQFSAPEGTILAHTLQKAPRGATREQRVKGCVFQLGTEASPEVEVNTFTILDPETNFELNGEDAGKTISWVRPKRGDTFVVPGTFGVDQPIPAQYARPASKKSSGNGPARGGKQEKQVREPGYAKAYEAGGEARLRVFSSEETVSASDQGKFKVGPASFNLDRRVLVADESGEPLTVVTSISVLDGPVNRVRVGNNDHDGIRLVYQRCASDQPFQIRVRIGDPDYSSAAPMRRDDDGVIAVGDYLLPIPRPGKYKGGETFELKAGSLTISGIWETSSNGLEVAHLRSNGTPFSNGRETAQEVRFRYRPTESGKYRVDYRLGAHQPSFGTRWDQNAGIGYVSMFGAEKSLIAGERSEGETFELSFATPEGPLVVKGTWSLAGDRYQIARLQAPAGTTFHCRGQHVEVCRFKFQKQADTSYRCVAEVGEHTKQPRKKAARKS